MREDEWRYWGEQKGESISVWMIWLDGRDDAWSYNLPPSSCKWALMLWFNAQDVKQRTNSCIEWYKRTQ